MGPAANVSAIEALALFRASLATFADQVKDALTTVDMEIQRTYSFLEEQKKYWEATHRKTEDEVFQCKNELARKRMIRIGDRKPDTTEEEKSLRKALAKLEHAEEKIASVRRWLRDLPDELSEYEGPSHQLQATVEGDVPRMSAYLERKIQALEAYVNNPPV